MTEPWIGPGDEERGAGDSAGDDEGASPVAALRPADTAKRAIAATLSVVMLGLLAVWLTRPEAPLERGVEHDRASELAVEPPAASAALAAEGVTGAGAAADDDEARQRDGRAKPGGALGDGIAILSLQRDVGRLFRAASSTTSLVVLVADPNAGGDDLASAADVAAALRRTRDYHLAVLNGTSVESEATLEAAIASARALLPHAPLATVVLAARSAAPVVVSFVARQPSVLALVLVSPSGALDDASAGDDPWAGLRGRQVAVVVGEHDASAPPFVSALLRLPLARTVRSPSDQLGWPLLATSVRARSDLAGWLFAVTPQAN